MGPTLTEQRLFEILRHKLQNADNLESKAVIDMHYTNDGSVDFDFNYQAGLLVGNPNIAAGVYNIDCDFSPGSGIHQGQILEEYPTAYLGGVIGRGYYSTMVGISLRGTLDFQTISLSSLRSGGGIVGELNRSNLVLVQNCATFESPLPGGNAGGIVGYVLQSAMTKCVNCMIGNIGSSSNASSGGIVGRLINLKDSVGRNGVVANADLFSKLVNTMTGDIHGSYVGGIFGEANDIEYSIHSLINYMTGNIVSSRSSSGGGIFGRVRYSEGVEVTSSINAMNGTVYDAIGSDADSTGTHPLLIVTVDNSFGLTYTTGSFGTTSPVTGLLTNTDFPSLPYVDLSGTDDVGNSYNFDFVYANLSGNSSYSSYTHLSLHKGDVSSPFHLDFNLLPTNEIVYLTYANLANKTVFTDDGPTILSASDLSIVVTDYTGTTVLFPKDFYFTPSPISVLVTIGDQVLENVPNYKLTYQAENGDEVTAFFNEDPTDRVKKLKKLVPETAYTVRVYSGNTLLAAETFSTLQNRR